MRKPAAAKRQSDKAYNGGQFAMATPAAAASAAEPRVHKMGPGIVCKTDTKGLPRPSNRSPAEIVVDASKGFIPLWAKDVTLRWRFQEQSMAVFQNPDAAKEGIKKLFGDALVAWGNAVPVKFTQRDDAWDFEIVMQASDDCDPNGCVLASAYFPDGGRHELVLYPKLFTQSPQEQMETLCHEIGHIFGLRHFFANVSETAWRSEIFGTHVPFSIMNYGVNSVLTENDRTDLQRLYALVWSGQLTKINGTPIKMVQPFSATAGNQFVMAYAAASTAKRRSGCCCCCGGDQPL
jgi:hypothetical protein